MNIQRATIRGFMGIELVEITPDDAVVQLAGGNGQGKTSAMLAVIGALGGKRALAKAMGLSADPGDEEIIKRGEEMAEVVVEFGGWVVTWTRERGKSDKVEIRGTDGGSHGRAKLGKLIGAIAFDPLSVDSMSPGERRATLLEMAGIDLGEIDGRRAAVYQRRRDVNTGHKLALARVGEAVDGAPEEAVDIGALESDLDEANDRATRNQLLRHQSEGRESGSAAASDLVDRAKSELSETSSYAEGLPAQQDKELADMKLRHVEERTALAGRQQEQSERHRSRIEGAHSNLAEAQAAAKEAKAAAAASRKEVSSLIDPDFAAIRSSINSGREANELYRMAQERLDRQTEAEQLGADSRQLTTDLAEIDNEKMALLAGAEMPIEGLGVSDDDGTIDDHLWATTNFSRRLQICVAISAELAGELKIAFVRSGGNDLDEEHYAALCKECKRWGLHLWIERNEPGEGAIVIKQGLVAS